MVLGIIFSLLGIGALVALMFNMAILALPLFAAVAAGRFAYQTEAGVLGAIAVGFVAGAAALGLGQAVLIFTRSTVVRLVVAFAFTAPAALAGYYLVLGLSHIGGAHGIWQQIFCWFRLGRHRRGRTYTVGNANHSAGSADPRGVSGTAEQQRRLQVETISSDRSRRQTLRQNLAGSGATTFSGDQSLLIAATSAVGRWTWH